MEKTLKFLKIEIQNHPLFEDKLEFSVVNTARVFTDREDRLTNLFGNIWTNNLIALVGRNATGKTTIMKSLIGALTFLLEAKSIDQTKLKEILMGKNNIKITTYFYGSDNYLYKDDLEFGLDSNGVTWHVVDEKIYQKRLNTQVTKKNLFDFNDLQPIYDRKNLDEVAASVLAPDDSIFRIVVAKYQQRQTIIDTLAFTNINALMYNQETVPGEILNFLDPTIEYLKIVPKLVGGDTTQVFYRLKFKGRAEEITETNFLTIEQYLSSGTAKGITLYGNVVAALKTGGIIFVDELENHFNHTIIKSFIEYFTDPKINLNRATLIYSTHYTELLNEMERGDEIYITRRDEKITLTRYSGLKIRNELVKSEVFDSDYIGGTVPEYDSYLDLRKATKRSVND
ncbi:AAA family ATPase [Limosilactobacillus equigenerosi]|uniref:ATPase AAA-type core domain-containing protein n=1 Tax=Limosilactobacillus equigenerosi DSM 18793 = JCM 14505 TaxID=1423742 RepID=A0A0R1UGT3_9LACO|nr:AAA family ATPase [Limosilactobacillus equigenerosi]KRL92084.1 hypothetical protein FC21_GL000461 [Limosilactobacillus equigenerosi DSM 18793 = JCM 14505]